jgi:hypothetical protein
MEMIEITKSACVIGALLAVSYLSVTAGMAVHTLEPHAAKILMGVNDNLTESNNILKHVNEKKTGTLDQADQAIHDLRLLVSHSDRMLTAQEGSIDKLNLAIKTSVDNLNVVLHSANGLILNTSSDEGVLASQATMTMVAAQNGLIELQRDETSANSAIADFQKQIDLLSPVVLATMKHTDETMDNVQGTTKDIRDKVHEELHPSKKKLGFWGTFGAGLIAIKKYDPLPSPELF